jgi:hypothetical protein
VQSTCALFWQLTFPLALVHMAHDSITHVTQAEACDQDGLFNFNEFAYCTLKGDLAAAIPTFLVLVVVVFYTLGVLADGYLCPNMVSLSVCCRMPVTHTHTHPPTVTDTFAPISKRASSPERYFIDLSHSHFLHHRIGWSRVPLKAAAL